eukprot:CAMPEP_0117420180 /NCGR_PEP_ID=MMETSP0758-20121206/1568_1 /TAXON_ID=63605 /ORGANISM="Percolomonas cosmopolitus, Strain AE-1 (ATCC 50343)" /LENGTH=252 /DNA_ID=CAMNT_0005201639 /DNA_START=842 /DNA_END=1597 /DNA_ORIENTATION=-
MGDRIAPNMSAVSRVGHMMDVMEQLEKVYPREVAHVRFNSHYAHDLSKISLKNVHCITPKNRLLSKNINIEIPQSSSLLIMGPSGCGKSSILRHIGCLWPLSNKNGVIDRPLSVGENGIFFLSQKTYMVDGSIKHQILYPLSPDDYEISDNEIEMYLNMVNLGYLASRYDFNQIYDWSIVLSLGEQQRIGMARLLYHKPKFAILDESTSALDIENENMMYSRCLERNISMISVGHRRNLMLHHEYVLEFDGK